MRWPKGIIKGSDRYLRWLKEIIKGSDRYTWNLYTRPVHGPVLGHGDQSNRNVDEISMQFDQDESVHLNTEHPKNGPYFALLILEELKHVIWRFR